MRKVTTSPALGVHPFLLKTSLLADKLTLWQPSKPYLYTMHIETDTDAYHLKSVGIRTVQVSGPQFLINGKAFYFFGVDKHEGTCVRLKKSMI